MSQPFCLIGCFTIPNFHAPLVTLSGQSRAPAGPRQLVPYRAYKAENFHQYIICKINAYFVKTTWHFNARILPWIAVYTQQAPCKGFYLIFIKIHAILIYLYSIFHIFPTTLPLTFLNICHTAVYRKSRIVPQLGDRIGIYDFTANLIFYSTR